MSKPPHVSAAQLRDALRRKLAALEAQDKSALAKQILLEKAGQAPVERPAAHPEVEIARNLLNGSGNLLPEPSDAPGVELFDVLRLRAGIRLALATLQSEEVRLGGVALAEWLQSGGEDRWLQHRRRLAGKLMAVQEEIAEGAAIRREATAAAGGTGVSLPSDRGDRPILSPHATTVLEAIRNEVMK